MRKPILALCLAGAGGLVAPAAIAQESVSTSIAATANRAASSSVVHSGARWGTRTNGRWFAGWNAPGGWHAYRRPVHGWALPRYWISPSFYIADFRGYGLPAPAYGYGWSRYYDDAVLTDRYGRVIDMRTDYDWDRYGGYDDGYYEDSTYTGRDYRDDRRDGRGNAVAGAVAGGLIGGIAGSAIAGRGNRTEGAIIGAGLGAVAGAAIGDSTGRRERDRRYSGRREVYREAPHGYGHDARDGVSYDGRWVGTWYGTDGTRYSGTYDGRYDGSAHWQSHDGAAAGPALPYAPIPSYGYSVNGAYYEAGTASSVYVAPVVTETTTITEEYSYQKARTPVYRKKVVAKPRKTAWRAKPKSSCSCSCVCR